MNKKILYLFIIPLIIFLYFSPAFIEVFYLPDNTIKTALERPHVYSGDEPHYVITVASLIEDLDFDLGNNYNKLDSYTYLNYLEINLNHHTDLINKSNKEIINWWQAYHTYNFSMEHIAKFNEYSWHFPGLPLFVSIFLFPLRYTSYIEAGMVLFTILFSLIGLYFLYKTLYYFDKKNALLITLIFTFASPLYMYSKMFYTESYLWVILIISFYLLIVKEKYFFSGLLLGIGIIMKYPFIIIAGIFWLVALYSFWHNKRYINLIKFSIPIIFSFIFILLYNYFLYSNPLYFPLPYNIKNIMNIFSGSFNLLFHRNYGLLPFAPFLIFSIFGIKRFYKEHKEEAIFIYSILILYFLFFSTWPDVAIVGQGQYSARYLIQILPLLAIPLLFWYNNSKSLLMKKLFLTLVLVSFIITLGFVLTPIYGSHPLTIINKIITILF